MYEEWYEYRLHHNYVIPRSYNHLNLRELKHLKRGRTFREGKLHKKGESSSESKEVSYEMKLLRTDQLDMVMKLQQKVYDQIGDEEVFQLTTKEEFEIRAQQKGRIIGVFAEEELIAFLALYFPGKEEPENLGRDVNLDRDELDKVAYFESLAVDARFRGNHLQDKMQQEAYDLALEMGYRHLMATVSHKNFYSLRNMVDFRFKVGALKEKYGGKLRYILHRNIFDEVSVKFNKSIAVKNTDVAKQQELLNDGYVGYQVHPGEGMKVFKVSYAPPVKA